MAIEGDFRGWVGRLVQALLGAFCVPPLVPVRVPARRSGRRI